MKPAADWIFVHPSTPGNTKVKNSVPVFRNIIHRISDYEKRIMSVHGTISSGQWCCYYLAIIWLITSPEICIAQGEVPQKSSLALPEIETTSATRSASPCYPCLSGDFWTLEKKSVVRIITFRESETISVYRNACSINTAKDGKPYILTANHCLSNQGDVDQTIFTFNYDDINRDGIPLSQALLHGWWYIASVIVCE